MFIAKTLLPSTSQGVIRFPLLEKAAEESLTVFSTPAGYLPADSLVAALEERGKSIVWLRLGPEDRDPGMLMSSLIQGIQKLEPEFGQFTRAQLKKKPGPLFGWASLFDALAQEIRESLPPDAALVIEQIHWLNRTPGLLELVGSRLFTALYGSVTSILISHQPVRPKALPEWADFRSVKDLRIDEQGKFSLLTSKYADVPVETIQRASFLLEGRLVCLVNLCNACGMLGTDYIRHIVQNSRDASEMLDQITRAALETSNDIVLQANSLAACLEYNHPLLTQAVLGSRVDLVEPWFQPLTEGWARVYNVWKRPLMDALRNEINSNPEILKRSAHYLAEQGAAEYAVRLSLEVEDYTSAAEIILGNAEQIISLGQWETLNNWLDKLPESVLYGKPWLVQIKGELDAAQGRPKEAQKSFRQANRLFFEAHDSTGICQSLMAQGTLAYWRSDLEQARLYALSASLEAEKAGLRWFSGWALCLLGRLYYEAGEPDKAQDYLDQAFQSWSLPLISKMAGLPWLTRAYLDPGKPPFLLKSRGLHRLWQKLQSLRRALFTPKTPFENQLPMTMNVNVTIAPASVNHIKANREYRLTDRPSTVVSNNYDTVGPLPPTLGSEPLISDYPPKLPTTEPGSSNQPDSSSGLTAYCLGVFRLYQRGQPVVNWNSHKAFSIFKYLLAHHPTPVPKDVLMATIWPDADQEAARRNLHQAIYALRQTLKEKDAVTQYVQFENDCYRINPESVLWLDHKEFERHSEEGQRLEREQALELAMSEYRQAESLYQGDFLAEDLYQDWLRPKRQNLWQTYLAVALRLVQHDLAREDYTSAVAQSQRILTLDPTQEETHQYLIKCYLAQGQRYLAMRQYQACVQILKSELGLAPLPETQELYRRIFSDINP